MKTALGWLSLAIVSLTASTAHALVCTAGDRVACHQMGVCNATGNQCVCDDPQHWWGSDDCANWHAVAETLPGQLCSPGDQAYCSWMGACDWQGMGCVCYEPEHWWASDRCAVWHEGPEPLPSQVCSPGTQSYCNGNGVCNFAGTGCVCTDSAHFWSSELCATWHDGPEPATCPPMIHVANHARTEDGMAGNNGFVEFYLATSTPTGHGRTCTYSRPNRPEYHAFIGRSLAANETSATVASGRDWQIELSDGTSTTLSCPAHMVLGPVSYFRTEDTVLTPIPAEVVTTQNEMQAVDFSQAVADNVFDIECQYVGFSDLSIYIPPPTRYLDPSACSGLYTPGLTLSERIDACPSLGDRILWQDAAGNVTSHSGYSYPSWTDAQKARMNQLYLAIEAGQSDLGIDCPDPAASFWAAGQHNDAEGHPVRPDGLALNLFFTANQAFDTFAAHVAWILYLEANQLLPWSIFDHPASELVEFFDSRRYHTRFPTRDYVIRDSGYYGAADYPVHIQAGRDYWNASTRQAAAWETVCDPRVGYQFLTGERSSTGTNLLGATELETLKKLSWWMHTSVSHGDPAADLPPSALLANSSFFLSNRLQPRRGFVIANAGCHSAANLFYDLAKSINIPLLHVATTDADAYEQQWNLPPIYIDYGRHSGLVYGWGNTATTLYLNHVDDLYANHGQIYPIDANGAPVADRAEALFNGAWLTLAELAQWDLHPTHDYGLQTPFSQYGNPTRTELDTHGVLAGYWLPTTTPPLANSKRFLWYQKQLLCGLGGGPGGGLNSWCGTGAPNPVGNWATNLGSTVLQAPSGTFSMTAPEFVIHMEDCAEAYSGLSGAAACVEFAYGGSFYTEWATHTAESVWSGPVGR